MHNAISLPSVVYDVTNSWITHIKCVIVARCYSAPPPFRQSHVDDEENALVVLIVVVKMWIEGSVQDHHAEEGFRLLDHHFRDKLVSSDLYTLSHSTLVNQKGFSKTFQDFIRSGVRWLEWSLNSILTKENMR